MSSINYKDLLPINDSKSLKEGKFKNLSIDETNKWRNFKNITKSEFIANQLANEQNNICPACNQIIESSEGVIHHLDYDRLCKYLECFRLPKPTTKQPNRKLKTPKCSKCPETDICKEKVVLIHNKCHFKIHIIEGRIKRPETKLKQEDKLEYWRNCLNKNHKEIIQKSINLFREINPQIEYSLKYYSRYIALKPLDILTFKNHNEYILIKIKRGNLFKMKDFLESRGIKSEFFYKKKELYSINFSINLEQFNENIELMKKIYKTTNENN